MDIGKELKRKLDKNTVYIEKLEEDLFNTENILREKSNLIEELTTYITRFIKIEAEFLKEKRKLNDRIKWLENLDKL